MRTIRDHLVLLLSIVALGSLPTIIQANVSGQANGSGNAASEFAERLLEQYKNSQQWLHYSKQPQLELNTHAAYRAQQALIAKRQNQTPIAGYKAGLTSSAGQKKFAVTQALSGALFADTQLNPETPIKLSNYGRLMIETELGFRLSRSISATLPETDNAADYFDRIALVVELPDLGFADPKDIKGYDLIANNVAAAGFMVGPTVPLDDIKDVNQLTVAMTRNAEPFNQGSARDALGDQWVALRWLINHRIEQGHQLNAGQWLITGSLGKLLPAQSGSYTATESTLGSFTFNIVE